MTRRQSSCEHVASIVDAERRPQAFCDECLAIGEQWVSLRVCLTCGQVSCAEDSPRDHAAQHYAETDHPIAASIGTEPVSRWCYPDRRAV